MNSRNQGFWGRQYSRVKRWLSSKTVQDRAQLVEDVLYGQTAKDIDANVIDMTAKLISTLARAC